jgi:hypothetical protein
MVTEVKQLLLHSTCCAAADWATKQLTSSPPQNDVSQHHHVSRKEDGACAEWQQLPLRLNVATVLCMRL